MTALALIFFSGLFISAFIISLPLPVIILFGLIFYIIKPLRLFVIFFIAMGYFQAFIFFAVSPPLPSALVNKVIDIQGVIDSIVVHKSYSQKLMFKADDKHIGRVSLSLYHGKIKPAIGERWQFTVKLKRTKNFKNPGGFNYERFLLKKGVRTTGYIKSGIKLHIAKGYYLARMRVFLQQQMKPLIKEQQTFAFLSSLLLGLRDELSKQDWQLFKNTGTSHLMAISGLHIGLVAFIFFFFTDFLWRQSTRACLWFPSYRAASLIACLAGTAYALLTGFSLSTQRAVIMIAAFMLARVFNRPTALFHSYFLALLVVLVVQPLAVFDVGFYLSFYAVFILVLIGLWYEVKRLWLLQVALVLTMVPLTLFFFTYASLLAVVANLIAIPLVSFLILPLGLLSIASLGFPYDLSVFLFDILACPVHLLLTILQHLSEWFPYGLSVYLSLVGFFFLLSFSIIMLLPRGLIKKPLSLFLLLPLFFPYVQRPNVNHANIYVLDVGQGLSVLVQTAHHQLLYDTGARFRSGFNLGEQVVVPFLKSKGLKTIDQLVISHEDIDHRGGEEAVKKGVRVLATLRSVGMNNCHQTKPWCWDGVCFTFLPKNTNYPSTNNSSCVLKVVSGEGKSVILTGDIENAREQAIVNDHSLNVRAEFLIAPHHGSNTSSTKAFIEAVSPSTVIYSTGLYNRFHFPHSQVIKRYGNIKQLNTATHGMIHFTL